MHLQPTRNKKTSEQIGKNKTTQFTKEKIEIRDLNNFDNKTFLCSFYEVDSIFKEKNIDIFNYVHGNVLNRLVQIETLGVINEEYYRHDDTRNCLNDMCGLKSDIAIKYGKPKLCPECREKIMSLAVNQDFLEILEEEFKTFKKPLFERILEFVKKRPVLSIFITAACTIILNIISSGLFELIKYFMNQKYQWSFEDAYSAPAVS